MADTPKQALDKAMAAMQRDALRYRHLRSMKQWTYTPPPMRAVRFSWFNQLDPGKLDAMIDADMANTTADGASST